jgi:thioredoxin reductase
VFDLQKGDIDIRLKDTTGWWGRCDALVLAEKEFVPADDLPTLNAQRIQFDGVDSKIKDGGLYDVVIVGAGSAGMGAALAAARNGASVALLQDRPVLGGNASDEIMVPPMGYIGKPEDKINVSGVAEELFPEQGWSNFGSSDHYLKLINAETNISLYLNTRGIGVEMQSKSRIKAVIGMNVHSGQRARYTAPLFIDTTGHGWIGFYAGAVYRQGTEAREEFGEAMAPAEANPHTMGNSLYRAVVEDASAPQPFVTPAWAYQWTSKDDFAKVLPRKKEPVRHEQFDKAVRGPGRPVQRPAGQLTWFVETGGMQDTITDAEKIRDELFRIHIGLWGYQKNYEQVEKLRYKRLVWLNYVPGVRESRRLEGDYMMTQKDFDEQINHADRVAFTDWGIDDHHPHGFFTKGIDVLHVYHGRRVTIPYRSLYSRNIENLFMAGRCMSVSHMALGGVRVQRPMAATGQAAGTAAAIAVRYNCLPRDIYRDHIARLQQTLLKDGCFIPGISNQDSKDLALTARTKHDVLNNGWNRDVAGTSSAIRWLTEPLTLQLEKPSDIASIHLTLQNRYHQTSFSVECLTDDGWKAVAEVQGEKHQRRFALNILPVTVRAVRFVLKESSGPVAVSEVRLYQEQGWTTQ